jgi:hypothetical protein
VKRSLGPKGLSDIAVGTAQEVVEGQVDLPHSQIYPAGGPQMRLFTDESTRRGGVRFFQYHFALDVGAETSRCKGHKHSFSLQLRHNFTPTRAGPESFRSTSRLGLIASGHLDKISGHLKTIAESPKVSSTSASPLAGLGLLGDIS